MPKRVICSKSLGRSIGGVARGGIPLSDGDGDGFVTNLITGEDNVPAPPSVVKRQAKGVDKYTERLKKKYDTTDEGGTGDCYQAAMNKFEELLRAEKDPKKRKLIKLVHGIPFGTGGDAKGRRFGHAWVEKTDPLEMDIDEALALVPERQRDAQRRMLEDESYRTTVYDFSNGNSHELPRVLYYGLGNINPSDSRYYTFEEMNKMISTYSHYGPWE